MKRIILFNLLFVIIANNYLSAQNPGWILAPNYIWHVLTLMPTPLPTSGGYNGQPPQAASNMQLDAQGNILFFVIDQYVYDKDGGIIGSLEGTISEPYSPYYCVWGFEGSELAIIPDPTSCSKYYIISYASSQESCGEHLIGHGLVYATLDFSEQRPNSTKMGKLSDVKFLNAPGHTWKYGDNLGVLIASSTVRNTGSGDFRYLFVSNNFYGSSNGIVRFKIDNSGVNYDGFIPYSVQNSLDKGVRAEMELIDLPNGHFKIALPYLTNDSHNGSTLFSCIYIAELDASGQVFNSQEQLLYFYKSTNNQDNPYIHGLEFSPDGSKLYISHVISQYHPNSLEYYDFTNPNSSDPNGNGIYALNIGSANNSDFQFSQIEYAIDQKMYFGAEGRLASLDNPNNPSSNTLADNAIIVPGYVANSGSMGIGVTSETKLYTLPDQIDGMNYKNSTTTTYEIDSYTAQASEVWKGGVGNNPWDLSSDVYVKEELIIPQGKAVTIQDMTFHFAPDAKVIIEQGGKLIIDNSTFTNSTTCSSEEENFWRGIQVYGTSDKNQFPESNPTYQGLLVIKNGGIIENAHLAVSNWKVDDYNSIGGVIQATDAVFRNNRRDVAFMSYQNYTLSYSNKYRNLSKFSNTDFVTDDDFIEKGLAIQTHVTMWKVDGITFTNCHFANEVSAINNSAPNKGIYSIDAGYTVSARCTTTQPIGVPCPSSNLLRSSFRGFKNGIEATGAGTSETVKIQHAEFSDNVWDISIDEFDNVSINRNEITTGNASLSPVFPIGVGINISNSTGFLVEENTISTSLTNGYSLGISVTDGGTDDNRLYKNNLEELTFGLYGNGINHNSNYQKGLQFLCNNLTNNQEAIRIGSNVLTDGVRFYQGEYSPQKSAGNTFANNTMDISNLSNSIVYMHNGGNTAPSNYQGLITLEDFSSINYCPSSFGGVVMIGSELALDSLGSKLGDLTTSYNDLNFAYTSLIDNGNTEEFKDNIELDWSADAWLLRSKLLASSPYLSSEVLLEAAKQNVLPNGMLLEILLANPDATRSERFIEELRAVTQNTFPGYMLDYVRENWDNRTLRTDMEGQLSSLHSELSNTRNWIKHLTKSKEERTYEDGLNVVKMGDEIYNKVGLMDFYIENNEFIKADSVLNAVQSDEKYEEDLGLIENFGDYINFRSNIGNRNLAQLDSTEISYLQTLAENKGRVAGYAQNILCFFYDICYEKELAFNEPQTKSNIIPNSKTEELNNILYEVKLFPNPAKDYTSIQWEIYDELNNAHYRIVDLNGRELLKGVLSENKGEQVIDTRKLRQGVYVIGIYNNNQLKTNTKLVVEDQR